MHRILSTVLTVTVIAAAVISCGTSSQMPDGPIRPATIEEVTLLDSPFKDNQDRVVETLLENYDADRFLARPRIAAGLEPKGDVYEGWETRLTGHTLGHYISGCARAWVITNNPEFKRRTDYMVDELAEIQAAHGNGFVAGPPDTKNQFENHIAKGDITSAGFDLNGIWVPIYGMHKIYAGLQDAYVYAGNEKALEVEHAWGVWMYDQLFHLSEELEARTSLKDLPDSDIEHINGDIERMYGRLLAQWLAYVEHLKLNYPFLFSLVLRTHPFQQNPSAVVT